MENDYMDINSIFHIIKPAGNPMPRNPWVHWVAQVPIPIVREPPPAASLWP